MVFINNCVLNVSSHFAYILGNYLKYSFS